MNQPYKTLAFHCSVTASATTSEEASKKIELADVTSPISDEERDVEEDLSQQHSVKKANTMSVFERFLKVKMEVESKSCKFQGRSPERLFHGQVLAIHSAVASVTG